MKSNKGPRHSMMRQLHHAAESLNVDKVQELIKDGADLNAKDFAGNTCICMLAQRMSKSHIGSKERETISKIIDILRENGADSTIENKEGLNAVNYLYVGKCARRAGKKKLLSGNKNENNEEEISSNKEVKQMMMPQLHQAAECLDIEKVKDLISSGADINAKDITGSTCICRMAKRYSNPYLDSEERNAIQNIMNILRENGADYNITNNSGQSATSFLDMKSGKNIGL
ncbi:ankyrin repeat family protein [Orientia tsutsugamushi str. Gilliam]|uniref:Ankyrin repeat family protein n=1 Tax=Orientia tsutsugamushi str. Gilliam TaxID=1359184 RepID=A0A0F3MD35_ORITS|nr:ankyrin repeat domain-containing protein [Orientia tsutsugamushi]KJV53551.1 ankyrin repeat family protein [Orientia tsutsugamushi str. Gilliam]SPR07772.1 ankyrin repeat-containing protein 13 [Orientia tsutsugamushi str. Gilliam]